MFSIVFPATLAGLRPIIRSAGNHVAKDVVAYTVGAIVTTVALQGARHGIRHASLLWNHGSGYWDARQVRKQSRMAMQIQDEINRLVETGDLRWSSSAAQAAYREAHAPVIDPDGDELAQAA